MDPRVSALAAGAVFSGRGRIIQMTSADGTSDYTYDKTSQLTGADHSYQTDETYTYDANGNRLSLTDANGHTTTYDYDALNRLTQITMPNSLGTVGYTYDLAGRVASITYPDATVVSNTYDAAGRMKTVTQGDIIDGRYMNCQAKHPRLDSL